MEEKGTSEILGKSSLAMAKRIQRHDWYMWLQFYLK